MHRHYFRCIRVTQGSKYTPLNRIGTKRKTLCNHYQRGVYKRRKYRVCKNHGNQSVETRSLDYHVLLLRCSSILVHMYLYDRGGKHAADSVKCPGREGCRLRWGWLARIRCKLHASYSRSSRNTPIADQTILNLMNFRFVRGAACLPGAPSPRNFISNKFL